MSDDLNSVKTDGSEAAASKAGGGYHHGDLRAALIAAAEAVIGERGVDGFSLREAARRAGVSPAAPQHHFGDARGLLTAVATLGFEGLCAALERADEAAGDGPDRRLKRIRGQGAAYVAFALAEPARFDVMWRKARIDDGDPAYRAAASRAFELLAAAVEDRPARAGAAPHASPPDPRAIACWSLVHGFARLALDGAFGPGLEAAAAAADTMLPAVIERLTF